MSMLARYKKTGGFIQLLAIVESAGQVKQEKFLQLIQEEDQVWAEAIQSKMLTIRKIISWDLSVLTLVTEWLPDLAIAMLAQGDFTPEAQAKIMATVTGMRLKRVERMIAIKKPTAGELNTVLVQVITQARSLISQGIIKTDSSVIIESNIEETLAQIPISSPSAPMNTVSSITATTAPAFAGEPKNELELLRRKVIQLKNENNQLKEKLIQTELKLAKIKKIA